MKQPLVKMMVLFVAVAHIVQTQRRLNECPRSFYCRVTPVLARLAVTSSVLVVRRGRHRPPARGMCPDLRRSIRWFTTGGAERGGRASPRCGAACVGRVLVHSSLVTCVIRQKLSESSGRQQSSINISQNLHKDLDPAPVLRSRRLVASTSHAAAPKVSPRQERARAPPATDPLITLLHGSTCCELLSAGFGFGGGVSAGPGPGPGDSDGARETPGGGGVVCLYAK